ncbi:tropomodulin-4 isoform X2 [Anopheles sinensis]|uniref:Tropomodulin-4 isoform X2 n=1 Tax=Anopheles sinensis TaxID=74873 RepID=A0A084WCI1_ANOSI|nr:tropomodulin-4 isoform X2 [Anopheles sinensis]
MVYVLGHGVVSKSSSKWLPTRIPFETSKLSGQTASRRKGRKERKLHRSEGHCHCHLPPGPENSHEVPPRSASGSDNSSEVPEVRHSRAQVIPIPGVSPLCFVSHTYTHTHTYTLPAIQRGHVPERKQS